MYYISSFRLEFQYIYIYKQLKCECECEFDFDFFFQIKVAKYFVCKQYPAVAYECMESLGGNGFVEDFPMARIYRQAPLNAIWEGSG
jgi:hypothetical protein